MLDLNGLKKINDTLGHEKGDTYIIDACKIFCDHFKHSPVFRIGGDEFVVILEGEDYQNRYQIKKSFNSLMIDNVKNNGIVVALGMAEYELGDLYNKVFDKADKEMYKQKDRLKNII